MAEPSGGAGSTVVAASRFRCYKDLGSRYVVTRTRSELAIPAKVFVGNLSFNTTKERLQEFLATAGSIVDLYLPVDRETGRMRGFAFAEFATEAEATAAIERFNGQELDGRSLRVNMAEDRPPRRMGGPPPRSFDGGPFGGGGGGAGDRGGGGGGDYFGGGKPFKAKGSRRNLRARKRGG